MDATLMGASGALLEEERVIYNEGERLIPGVTHDVLEHIRHQSSYEFFCNVIRQDHRQRPWQPIRILDLGFGAGWGCQLLAAIPDARVVGVDISEDCKRYAEKHYSSAKVKLVIDDLWHFVNSTSDEFDYVVSRGVLEHVPNGLEILRHARWRQRVMANVPYDEKDDSNPHHVLSGIVESDFDCFDNAELLFEDLQGVIYDRGHKPPRPNMIMCVVSSTELPSVGSLFDYPIPAWHPPGYLPEASPLARKRPSLGARILRELRRLKRKVA